jgi:hypothetical protein
LNPDQFAYMGGILKNYDSRLLDAGGTSDQRSPAGLAIKEHRPERVAERSKEKQFSMDQDCGKKI